MDDLLIATWCRVFVRRANGDIVPVLDRGAPFYGLTWDRTYLYVGARSWDSERRERLVILDRSLRKVDEYELPTNELHQILWRDGWLYLTDTKADRVLRWYPGSMEVIFDLGTGADVHHINSLWHDGEHFWAAGLHGHVWRDWELWSRFPFEIHNIYVEDGDVITLASRRQAVSVGGRLVSLEGIGNPWPAYTHGLARGPDAFYVGAAMLESERDKRKRGDSAIAVFDGEWQRRDVLYFEGVGGVHDIRVLGDDRAHNGVTW